MNTASKVMVRIDHIFDAGSGKAITVDGAGSPESVVDVGEIDCDIAYSVAASARLYLIAGKITGTPSLSASAFIRVTEARRDNLTATTDPTVNNDGDDGYDVGSRWKNTASGKWFTCDDPSSGAAVWTLRVTEEVNSLSTTDATVTTIATIPIPDDTAVWIEVDVIARRTNAADRGKWKRGALVYRESAGAATREGSVWTPLTIKSDAAWDVDIAVSGNNALIRVTGAAGHDLNWTSRHVLEERT